MNENPLQFDTNPGTYLFAVFANLLYLAAEPSVVMAVVVPLISIIGSGLVSPFAREAFRFYFDRRRHREGLPPRKTRE